MTFDFTTIDLRVLFAALAVILTFIGIFYFQWFRNRKRLSYEILSDVELVSSEKIRGKVEILYEGQRVESVYLVVVKLVNDGYQPIKKDEFEKPARFLFKKVVNKKIPPRMRPPEVKVLTAEKEEFQPENIATEITYQDNWVEIAPALFNRKDYVQFKVLLNGLSKMEVDARVVGVSYVGKAGPKLSVSDLFFMLGFLAMGVFGLYQWWTNPSQVSVPDKVFFVFVVLVPVIGLFVKFLWRDK